MTWPPAKGSLSPASNPQRRGDRRAPSLLTHGVRGPAAAVAEDDRRNARRRRRHRMAVEQQRAAETVEQKRDLLLDRAVIGPVRLVEPVARAGPG